MAITPSKTGLDPDKYIVRRSASEPGEPPRILEADEVFVLKRGDALATAALRSYVQNALLLLDVDKDLRNAGRFGILSSEEQDRLQALADDVSQLANDWEDHNHGKLPD